MASKNYSGNPNKWYKAKNENKAKLLKFLLEKEKKKDVKKSN